MEEIEARRYPKKKTACWRLFHYSYPVWYPQLFKYSTEYIQKRGYHVSGDGTLDQQRMMEPGLFNQTPAGMAMLIEEGAPIDVESFSEIKDIPYIYADIQEHLMDWEKAVNSGIHINEVPDIQDFRLWENLAIILYPTARFLQPEEQSSTLLVERLKMMSRQRSPINRRQQAMAAARDEEGNLKPYVSIVDRIEKEIIGGNVWR